MGLIEFIIMLNSTAVSSGISGEGVIADGTWDDEDVWNDEGVWVDEEPLI